MYPHDSHYNRSNTQAPRRPRRSAQGKRLRRRRRSNALPMLCTLLGLVLITTVVMALVRPGTPVQAAPPEDEAEAAALMEAADPETVTPPEVETPEFTIHTTPDTLPVADDFPSQYVVLLDLETGEVLVERDSEAVINPASMTKILTLLVAVENITDWNKTHTIDLEITDYCFFNRCSVVGYELGEVVYPREALFGCILCSGADACLALAEIACGSHEAFVEKMNEKVEELGLSQTTHFTNCVGLYDEDHHCSVRDMAIILKAALENEVCRTVLTTKIFNTQPTSEHPDGQVLSNWFIRRIEDLDMGDVTVLAAKTGYVSESGFCAASYAKNEEGREFLCVTGDSTGTWQSIYDHQKLYQTYCQSETAAAS